MGILRKIYKKRERLIRERKNSALDTAKRIAKILGEKFGATKVILYGSLAKGRYFDISSDIDIAVSGIKDKFFSAYRYCKDFSEFDIEIKDYNEMPKELKEKLEREGRILYDSREKV